jgi:signal transduction histidine kinase
LKNYEIESGLKSFALFFALITSIYILFLYQTFSARQNEFDRQLLQQMRIFSFDPTGKEFDLEFVPADESFKLLTLYHGPQSVYGYFVVPTEDGYLMKVSLPLDRYLEQIEAIRSDVRRGAIWYLLLIGVISFLLAYYSLHPIRRAMRLNKEFMKDILHDVNTPIASIAINLKILQKKFGEHKAIDRIWNNIETIGMLRENLQAYLGKRPKEIARFDLGALIEERLEYFRILYPNVTFENRVAHETYVRTERHACTRILDNLISNAGKYNKPGGRVSVELRNDTLVVSDTGQGMRQPQKAFLRHYKEGERGMGLGLNIVYNLCKELGISVRIESTVDVGTHVYLACAQVRVE